MNALKLLRETAYGIIQDEPIEKTTMAEILRRADVSKQTLYLYHTDKYALANEAHYNLFGWGVICADRIGGASRTGGRIYGRQFHRYWAGRIP